MTTKHTSIVIVGHVDHGKSSVVGRLLADADVLPSGKLEAIKENCARAAKPFEYAYLLDALQCEQAQNITLDIARCHFDHLDTHYEVLDAPGHLELLKNMVTGASRADAAILVVDASKGVEDNTKRHAFYLQILGVDQLFVAINKMDLVRYSQESYDAIVRDLQAYLEPLRLHPLAFIPISAKNGDNIVGRSQNMPWYIGHTVLQQITQLSPCQSKDSLPLRLPIQDVYKWSDDTRRIIAGTIATGRLQSGESIRFFPSGKSATIKSVETTSGKDIASAGEAVGLTIVEDLFVQRGELICAGDLPSVANRAKVHIFWFGSAPLKIGSFYVLKTHTCRTIAFVSAIENVIDAIDQKERVRDEVCFNEVATLVLDLQSQIAFDTNEAYPTNKFVLVDDYDIVGGGSFVQASQVATKSAIPLPAVRQNAKGHVFWLCGLSGSGKSTIAAGVCRQLTHLGVHCYVLDGDELRAGINADLDYSKEGRMENIRRAAHIAKILAQAGVVVIATFITPLAQLRELAKDIVGEDYHSVFVSAPIEVCAKRDPKQLYAKAQQGTISQFTGISAPFEAPTDYECKIDTDKTQESDAVEQLKAFILDKIEF